MVENHKPISYFHFDDKKVIYEANVTPHMAETYLVIDYLFDVFNPKRDENYRLPFSTGLLLLSNTKKYASFHIEEAKKSIIINSSNSSCQLSSNYIKLLNNILKLTLSEIPINFKKAKQSLESLIEKIPKQTL